MSEAKEGIGVIVVDDNDLIGGSMERWLTGPRGMRWLGWTADLAQARSMIAERQPDVLLLDVDMPGADTFALLKWVIAKQPGVRVLMLSGHLKQDYIERALDEGAAGYIVKDESPRSIVEYVRRAAAGEVVLSPSAQAWVAGPM